MLQSAFAQLRCRDSVADAPQILHDAQGSPVAVSGSVDATDPDGPLPEAALASRAEAARRAASLTSKLTSVGGTDMRESNTNRLPFQWWGPSSFR